MKWFGRRNDEADAARNGGSALSLDGYAAAHAVETMTADALVVGVSPELSGVTGPLANLAPAGLRRSGAQPLIVQSVSAGAELAGLVAGYAAAGMRSAAMPAGDMDLRRELAALAGRRLPCVYHLTGHAMSRQGTAAGGGHDEYIAASGSGAFLLFASNAQEVADLTLIAHRVAEMSLTPGVCAQDLYRTSHAVQRVQLVDDAFASEWLGEPGDTIESPTPAQAMLFGERRRRIPRLVDIDHPAGLGGNFDAESYPKSVVAQQAFFASSLGGIIDEAMAAFAARTGRHYSRVSGYRVDDADVVVLAQGAIVEELCAVADYLRAKERIKAGVINVTAFRPFPGAELTRLLAGRKAVTILERVDDPLATDLPLARDVRGAIDRSTENALAGEDAYPGFVPMAEGKRPQIFAGVYGAGGDLPSFDDLAAVFRNMKGERKRRFHVGIDVRRDLRRFPHLQSLQQRIEREYPALDTISAGAGSKTRPETGDVIGLHSLSVHGGLFAGNLFSQVLADVLGFRVATFPRGGLEPVLSPAELLIVHGDEIDPRTAPAHTHILLVTAPDLLDDTASRAAVSRGGTLVVGSSGTPEDLLRRLPPRTATWVRDDGLRLCTVDTREIAGESSTEPSFTDQLAIWALLGGALRAGGVSDEDVERIAAALRERLAGMFGGNHPAPDDITRALSRGAAALEAIDAGEIARYEIPPVTEPEPPWAVREVAPSDMNAFDLTRFWHSVGYLHDTGQSAETLVDPYLATGIMPARSSTFRDMSSFRLKVPRWIAEKCTACGDCWSLCPDSALPPSSRPVSTLIQSALESCERDGIPTIQMRRVSDHLAKQAYRMVKDDDLHQYTTTGALLAESYERLMEKMKPGEQERETLDREFAEVRRRVEGYPFARTETLFDERHAASKGSGELFTIAVNPDSCKGCGICVANCPEQAFEWSDQSPEMLGGMRAGWEFQMSLPAVPVQETLARVRADDARTQALRMLDRDVYHALVGGDAASPGSGAKTATHLVTATIDSIMRERFAAHVARLDDLVERLKAKIQGDVAGAVAINDFEGFARRLTRVEHGTLSPDELAAVAGGEALPVDAEELRAWTDLLARLVEQRRLYCEGSDGKGRARMLIALDGESAVRWSGSYPYNPHASPWICLPSGEAPGLARALFAGVSGQIAGELRDCRLAQLMIDGAGRDDDRVAALGRFGWEDLNAEERALVPPTLVLLDEDAAASETVLRLLGTGLPLSAVVLTRSTGRIDDPGPGLAPLALRATGAFVLQSSVGYPGHLMEGVAHALTGTVPSLLYIHAPDPIADGLAPESVPDRARTAAESRLLPLLRRSAGEISLEGNPQPQQPWAERALVFHAPSGVETDMVAPVTPADWAVGLDCFRDRFRFVGAGHLNPQMKPLAEYIELDEEAREGFEPFVHVVGDAARHLLAIVPPEFVRASERARDSWRSLTTGPVAAAPAPAPAKEAPAPVAKSAAPAGVATGDLAERLLQLCGYAEDPAFFNQSLREFIVARRRESDATDDGDTTTRH